MANLQQTVGLILIIHQSGESARIMVGVQMFKICFPVCSIVYHFSIQKAALLWSGEPDFQKLKESSE
jgi:hypothetical protein